MGVGKRTIQRVKAQIQAGYGEALATGSETLRSLAAKARKAAAAGAQNNDHTSDTPRGTIFRAASGSGA